MRWHYGTLKVGARLVPCSAAAAGTGTGTVPGMGALVTVPGSVWHRLCMEEVR